MSWFLPRLIGLARAKSLAYRSPRVLANDAEKIGLVDAVFPAATFRDDAFRYASDIANRPTQAYARMKANLHNGLTDSLDSAFALEARNMIESGGGDEAREAISAFQEKRRPVFHPVLDSVLDSVAQSDS